MKRMIFHQDQMDDMPVGSWVEVRDYIDDPSPLHYKKYEDGWGFVDLRDYAMSTFHHRAENLLRKFLYVAVREMVGYD